jgi:hypothetical protein
MSRRPHILIVNGRKVQSPVFVLGGPHSGTELIARALKRTPGFHVTIGQPAVLNVVYALARSPSIQRGRAEATATVLRDALAQSWRLTPQTCLSCLPECRRARPPGDGTCADERAVVRYGDASPELVHCAESLAEAFPDARLVQVIRDGRAVVAAMLADPAELAWLRPGVANVDSEFPNPFYGIETEPDRAAWAGLSAAARCAMRWRGSVQKMARLRGSLDNQRLTTFRYEEIVRGPRPAAEALSDFIGARIERLEVPAVGPAAWRGTLSSAQLAEIEKIAGPQLRRVGYGD